MVKNIFICFLISLILTFILGCVFIPILKNLKAKQTILKYVENHKNKNGTPTMGGLFFIPICAIIYFLFCGIKGKIANAVISIGLAYLLVGFIDDFIKIKFMKNEGLKPYQKIIFQSAIALVSGLFCYFNGLTVLYIPFVKKTVDFSFWIVPFTFFIFLAITNSVNLTDGIDALASSVSLCYLIFILVLIGVEQSVFLHLYLQSEEYEKLMILTSSLIGGIFGFLIFNVPKAKVFMGDTGSLSLGGFIGAISIFSGNSLFIPILGICFVFSSVSVILQVLYFKKTKGKRIFLMSPFHHHLELKGVSESKISYLYSLVTIIMGAILLISYL